MAMESTLHISAMERVFATTELFEYIFTYLLCPLPPPAQVHPSSSQTVTNALTLRSLGGLSRVNRTWYENIRGSKCLQRALFFLPDTLTDRAWTHIKKHDAGSEQLYPRPFLNPVVQRAFFYQNFRFCRSSSSSSTDEIRYSAFFMVDRNYLPTMVEAGGLAEMLLSQPPCTRLDASIYDERDETKEYVGRTKVLADPVIEYEHGLTLGMVHRRVREMFEAHEDVVAIKLVTA